jgi:hypothetical protein
MWIGECKLPVAARSEYAGYLLRTATVETVGRDLADALPADARFEPLVGAPRRASRTRRRSACTALPAEVEPNQAIEMHMT